MTEEQAQQPGERPRPKREVYGKLFAETIELTVYRDGVPGTRYAIRLEDAEEIGEMLLRALPLMLQAQGRG